jgi:hypothetical protein
MPSIWNPGNGAKQVTRKKIKATADHIMPDVGVADGGGGCVHWNHRTCLRNRMALDITDGGR